MNRNLWHFSVFFTKGFLSGNWKFLLCVPCLVTCWNLPALESTGVIPCSSRAVQEAAHALLSSGGGPLTCWDRVQLAGLVKTTFQTFWLALLQEVNWHWRAASRRNKDKE